jgi:hypothetical protein
MSSATNAQVFPDAEILIPTAELAFWTRPDVASMDFGPARKGLAS